MNLPKGVRQRGNSLLVDATYKDERRTATIKIADFDTPELAVAEAVKLKAELLYSMQTGKRMAVVEDKVWTIEQAFKSTERARWNTKGTTRQHLNGQLAMKFFGKDTKLDKIGTSEILDWIAELEEQGNSDATINRKLSALQTMMTQARDHQPPKLDRVPKMPRRKEGKGRIRFLTDREELVLLSLLEQWEKLDERDAVIVLVDTGMRRGELNRLEGRDLDFKTGKYGVVNIWMTKADKPRTVPLTPRAAAILRRRTLAQEGTGEPRLFPYQDQWLRHTWDRARVAMKLENDHQFVIHALRHTCASRLVQGGKSLKIVQEWLGHATITMTERYSHLAPTNLYDAVDVLTRPENVVPIRKGEAA